MDSGAAGADQALEGERRSPGPKAEEPHSPPGETDLSPDPYRKVPSGKGERERPEPEPPAAFKAPSAEATPATRPLRSPTRLAVSFVREGRFVLAGRALLRLEASLSKVRALREVVGHPLPRGTPRDLAAVGREAREAGGDLLLVVSLPDDPAGPPGQAWLVHCQHEAKEPVLLAHFDPPPAEDAEGPTDAALTSDEPDSVANLVARIALAHRQLRTSK